MVASMPRIPRPVLKLLGCWIQKLGRLPHQTSPRHLPWNPQDNSCWYLGTGWHLSHQPLCLTTGPQVSLFRYSLFLFTFPFSNWELFPHIMNVAARVCRSPDSWPWSDQPQISLTHSPTPPNCSSRASMALINNQVLFTTNTALLHRCSSWPSFWNFPQMLGTHWWANTL